jgi:hypothetical protein
LRRLLDLPFGGLWIGRINTQMASNTNYAEFLQWVNIAKFAEACHNISCASGAQVLNEHSNRMLKEKYILGALRKCNHAKNIQWIDTIDYDLIFDDWNNATVEVKTGDGPIFTEKKGNPKQYVEVKLKNIYESKENTRTTLDKTFDYLMVVQNTGTFAVAFVDYATVSKHLVRLSDGFKARIPFADVNIIYKQDMRNMSVTWTVDLDPKLMVADKLTEAGL